MLFGHEVTTIFRFMSLLVVFIELTTLAANSREFAGSVRCQNLLPENHLRQPRLLCTLMCLKNNRSHPLTAFHIYGYLRYMCCIYRNRRLKGDRRWAAGPKKRQLSSGNRLSAGPYECPTGTDGTCHGRAAARTDFLPPIRRLYMINVRRSGNTLFSPVFRYYSKVPLTRWRKWTSHTW